MTANKNKNTQKSQACFCQPRNCVWGRTRSTRPSTLRYEVSSHNQAKCAIVDGSQQNVSACYIARRSWAIRLIGSIHRTARLFRLSRLFYFQCATRNCLSLDGLDGGEGKADNFERDVTWSTRTLGFRFVKPSQWIPWRWKLILH